MPRCAALIEYDGYPFKGWQKQVNQRTVQGDIEAALEKLLGKPIETMGSGRTDAGVHAECQVAHFDIPEQSDLKELQYRLNRVLPFQIAIKGLVYVSDEFHARFDAGWRQYRYDVVPGKRPILQKQAWTIPEHIQIEQLKMYASSLLGKQDFEGMSKKNVELDNYTCDVMNAEWSVTEEGVYRFRIRANRFLHNMVRRLVGSMVKCADQNEDIVAFKHIVKQEDKKLKSFKAPAYPLVLEKVFYENLRFFVDSSV